MTKLLFAASAAAILTVAGHLPAMAQSSTTGMSSPMITCRDITTMDREMARSVVFYVSGFQAASDNMQNQASGTGTTGTTGSGSTSADASSGTTGTTGTSGSTSADAGSGSDVTGSTSSAGGTASGTSDTSGTASSGSASGASGGASSAVIAQLPGFSSIDIDRIMSDCASSPDRQLSEMVGQGASGATTTP